MHTQSENANLLEPNTHSIPPSTIVPQPWWRDVGYNTAPSVSLGERTSKSSSLEPPDSGMGTKTSQSQGDGGLNEGTGVTKEMQTSVMPQSGSDGKIVQEHQHLQYVASIPPTGGEFLVPHTQLELIGHSVACASYPYSDPYYGGIMAAYGTQSLQVHPHLLGMHHPRMPLPLEMAEEPVYVNAKQYHGILRRRQSRAKAELEKKLIKVRKPYLHESRHQHAMRRERGCGGRFLNKKQRQNDSANPTPEKGRGSAHSASSTLPSGPTRNLDSSNGQLEVMGLLGQEMHDPHTYSNGCGNNNTCYRHQEFRLSTFHTLSGEGGDEGDCSGQQRGSIPVSQAPHRALTIQ